MATILNERDVLLRDSPIRDIIPRPLTVSLSLPLSDAVWVGVPLATVADGAVGTQVRRSVAGTQGILTYGGAETLLDKSRIYRTRFRARASSDANGTLYHCLRQFLPDGSPGPVNLGRAPYQPENVAAHTDWKLYSHIWEDIGTTWQAGVTQIRPYILLNSNGTAGYWEIQDYVFEDVTEAVLAQRVADAALQRIENISSDNILSRGEKVQLATEMRNIDAEWAQLRAQAGSLVVPYSVYDTRRQELYDYLTGLSPVWNDVLTDTTIVRSDFRLKFENYYKEKQALINAVVLKASTMASGPKVIGTDNLADGAATGVVLVTPADIAVPVKANDAAGAGFTTIGTYTFTPVVTGPVIIHYALDLTYVTTGGGPFGFSPALARIDTGAYDVTGNYRSSEPTTGGEAGYSFLVRRLASVTAGVPVTFYLKVCPISTGAVDWTAKRINLILEIIKK